ncbi:hypothetical protein GCM10028801_31160 [Nocardioides maradonensis]
MRADLGEWIAAGLILLAVAVGFVLHLATTNDRNDPWTRD